MIIVETLLLFLYAISIIYDITSYYNGIIDIFILIRAFAFSFLVIVLICIANAFATKDMMTNIANRERLVMYIGILRQRRMLGRYSAIFLNIADFRFINRTTGSENGDEVLITYCNIIRDRLERGEIIARMGGDNFVLLVRDEHLRDILDFLECVEVSVRINDTEISFPIRSRSGYYDISEDDCPSEVLSRVSLANSICKSMRHTSSVQYVSAFSDRMYHEQKVNFSFEKALADGEFVLYYQPKVDSSDNTLTGAEALSRWIQNGKIIPPLDFIPALEGSGLISKLDFFVFEENIKNIIKWQEMGMKPVPISTNFSKVNFSSPTFAEDIIAIVDKYDIDRDLIRVEVTESVELKNLDYFNTFLKKLYDAGIKTSIDDFGVGYSSLELLSSPYIDSIKIDKTFFTNIETDDSRATLASCIIRSAIMLDKKVICEGIENKNQIDIINDAGASIIQGFFFDKPLAEEVFIDRLQSPVYSMKG